MKNMNRDGYSIIELIIGLAIIATIIAGAGFAGMNALNSARDNGTVEDLKALAQATNTYMIDTNGVSPCFSPDMYEGADADGNTTVVDASKVCKDAQYDYVQGRIAESGLLKSDGTAIGADAYTLDFDNKGSEAFTPTDILVPTYLQSIPLPRRAGQVYIYTKGIPTTNAGSQAFAYSDILSGPKAKDIINDNISVLNVMGDSTFLNSARLRACSTSDVSFKGQSVPLNANATTDTTRSFVYKYYTALYTAGDANAFSKEAAGAECDIYSEGNNLQNNNFNNTIPSLSVNYTG